MSSSFHIVQRAGESRLNFNTNF